MIVSKRFRGFGEAKLQWGASGDSVKSLQKRLIALGVPNVSVTGKFDAGTLAAVRYFQAASGISADGIVGDATWAKIHEAEGSQVPDVENVMPGATAAATASTGPSFLDTLGSTLVSIFKPGLPLIGGEPQYPVYQAPPPSQGVPTWVWVAGGVGAGALLLTIVAVSAGGRRSPA